MSGFGYNVLAADVNGYTAAGGGWNGSAYAAGADEAGDGGGYATNGGSGIVIVRYNPLKVLG